MCAAVFSKPTSMLQKYVEQTQREGKKKADSDGNFIRSINFDDVPVLE